MLDICFACFTYVLAKLVCVNFWHTQKKEEKNGSDWSKLITARFFDIDGFNACKCRENGTWCVRWFVANLMSIAEEWNKWIRFIFVGCRASNSTSFLQNHYTNTQRVERMSGPSFLFDTNILPEISRKLHSIISIFPSPWNASNNIVCARHGNTHTRTHVEQPNRKKIANESVQQQICAVFIHMHAWNEKSLPHSTIERSWRYSSETKTHRNTQHVEVEAQWKNEIGKYFAGNCEIYELCMCVRAFAPSFEEVALVRRVYDLCMYS